MANVIQFTRIKSFLIFSILTLLIISILSYEATSSVIPFKKINNAKHDYEPMWYINKPILNLYGTKLFAALLTKPIFSVTRWDSLIEPLGTRLVGLGGIVYRFNGIDSRDPVLRYGCGRFVKVDGYEDHSNNITIGNITYEYCNILLTSFGYEYFRYLDGNVSMIYPLSNDTIDWIGSYLANYTRLVFNITGFSVILNDVNISVSIVYTGVGADRISVSYEYEYEVVNNTLTPVNRTYVKLVNPYYKFYLFFGDIRFAYPIKIGIEDVNGTPQLKFIEMFIPPLSIEPFTVNISKGNITINKINIDIYPDIYYKFIECNVFVIDHEYLNKIAEEFKKAIGISSISMDNIIVADLYYMPSPDYKYLRPVLKLYSNTTEGLHYVVSMELFKTEPHVISVTVVAGMPSPSDPNTLLNEIHEIVQKIKREQELIAREREYHNMLTLAIVVASVSTIVLLTLFVSIRKYRK